MANSKIKFKNEKEFKAFQAKQAEEKMKIDEDRQQMNEDDHTTPSNAEHANSTEDRMHLHEKRNIGSMQPAGRTEKDKLVEKKEQLEQELENKKLEKEIKSAEFKLKHPVVSKIASVLSKSVNVPAEAANEIAKQAANKSSSKKKNTKSDSDFTFEEEDDEEEKETGKKGKKKSSESSNDSVLGNLAKGTYEGAYDQGFGRGGYNALYESKIGTVGYTPAYKTSVPSSGGNIPLPNTAAVQRKKPAVEEEGEEGEVTQTQTQREPDRFNMQNWKSMGFPNTLPQKARSPLFQNVPQNVPAPQQQPVVPMVQQPYQPRPSAPQMTFMGSNPYRSATPQGRFVQQQVISPGVRRPSAPFMSGPMPRIGGAMGGNTPQIVRPDASMVPVRAPQAAPQIMRAAPAPITFLGVPMGGNRQQGNKPITRIGEGMRNPRSMVFNGVPVGGNKVPSTSNASLYLMRQIYPVSSYNPNKDLIMKKSTVVPRIGVPISDNSIKMFGIPIKKKVLER